MKKLIRVIIVLSLVVVGILGTTGAVLAAPPPQANHGNDFVCPVIPNEKMGMHNPNAVELGTTGTYTVGQPTRHTINVPDQATNGGGSGVPGGPQSQPGDKDYTAIWNGDIPD